MKFIADSMLGRLARWLRIMGCDTLYYPDIDDSVLLRIAREDRRTLLTRDTRLLKIKGLKDFIFIHDDSLDDQLRELFNEGVIDESSPILSRCIHCNTMLCSIPSDKAEGAVPDFVLWKSEEVRQCPSCGKIYWKGTHLEKIREKLNEVLSRIEKKGAGI